MRQAIFLILLFVFLIAKAQDEGISRQNELVLFKVNKTQCSMYSNKCFLNVLAKDLDLNSIKSENDKLFTVISVTKCEKDSPNNTQLCPDFDYFNLTSNSEEYSIYIIKLDPISFGPANLTFFNEENEIFHFVSITEPRRWIDILFDVYVWTFQICISIIMGCLLDWEILKQLLVVPIPALIGLCCQYIMMPLLAYTFVSIFSLSPPEALALFIYGCCPGGSASNTWTILFEGDINLSAIMTFISTVTAFIAMPAWIFTLGSTFTARANLQIPYLMLLANIFITVGPCIFGFLLSHFIPKVKKGSHHRYVKRIILATMITFFSLVLLTKSWSFSLMSWQNLLAGPLIPWAGYFVGGLVAYICRLPWTQIKTISIETGLQNVGVAFLIVITNFPSPSKEMAYLPLISVAFLTFIPLYIIFGIKSLINCILKSIKKPKIDENTVEEAKEMITLNEKA